MAQQHFLEYVTSYRINPRLARTSFSTIRVLRSFPSQVHAEPKWAQLTSRVEQALIEQRVPFQIIYDQKMRDLHRYQVLVLAGCVALSDSQIKRLRDYVASGGRLCIIGPVATHDEWLRPRSKPILQDLPPARVVRFSESDDCLAAVQRSAMGGYHSQSRRRQSCVLKLLSRLGADWCIWLIIMPTRRLPTPS